MQSSSRGAARKWLSTIWAVRLTVRAALPSAADAVVAEITAAGGEAIADGASVTDDTGVAAT